MFPFAPTGLPASSCESLGAQQSSSFPGSLGLGSESDHLLVTQGLSMLCVFTISSMLDQPTCGRRLDAPGEHPALSVKEQTLCVGRGEGHC